MDHIIEPVPGVRFACISELEQWRATSLLTKEPETIAWLDAYLGERAGEGILFDVGANVGSYSIYAGTKYGAAVYAFEPVWENFVRLQVNAALNACPRLFPFQFALGDKNELVELFLKDSRVGNSGAQIRAPLDEVGAEFIPVATRKVLSVSLDTLVFDFAMPCPTLIKIDIDGLEQLVFRGGARTLASASLQSILVELNSREASETTAQQLSQYGFQREIRFDELDNHSSKRRRQNGANVAENVCFSKRIE